MLSSFLLDLLIAVEYLIRAKSLPRKGKISIAATKMLGDIFAWMAYMRQSTAVLLLGAAVLGANLFYLWYCVEERKTEPQ